jgi:hypothetical protein
MECKERPVRRAAEVLPGAVVIFDPNAGKMVLFRIEESGTGPQIPIPIGVAIRLL